MVSELPFKKKKKRNFSKLLWREAIATLGSLSRVSILSPPRPQDILQPLISASPESGCQIPSEWPPPVTPFFLLWFTRWCMSNGLFHIISSLRRWLEERRATQ
ncbi:hypothetical protein JCGZ_06528 [Jatropha curcas]|uniref:Uncharacterized protein n=1 Tax=Jatropha curcas TaxID=180498 RepID=A0A067LPF0_JATCU|nr:hypothetical protein JCGZ_06528 [Jatropha curcas]